MGTQDIILFVIERARDFIVPAILAFVWFIVGTIIIRIISYRIKRRIIGDELDDNIYNEKIGNIVGLIVTYVGQSFNVLIAFQILGLNVGILMAGVSFGIGFAMQQILENMFAGFLIVTNPMIKVGETVSILGSFNQFGRIEALQSRYTVIRLVNGRKLILPNTVFMRTPIQTFKREDVVRGEVLFTVEHHIPIEQVQKLIIQEIVKHPSLIQKEKITILPTVVDGAGTNFKVYFFMNPKQPKPMYEVKSDLRKIVMKTLTANRITVPYPKKILDFT